MHIIALQQQCYVDQHAGSHFPLCEPFLSEIEPLHLVLAHQPHHEPLHLVEVSREMPQRHVSSREERELLVLSSEW